MNQKAIVIGSGFGGLAAALRLRAKGYQVKVLEAGPQPGGRARVFTREDFRFDAGPTVVTAPYLLDELFSLFGEVRSERLELLPVDPFYRVLFDDGASFDYVGEEERLLAQIHELSPQDEDGYRKLADHARRIFDVGYTGLADQPFHRASAMLGIVPDLLRLSGHRSVYSLVSRYIKDERLRQVFSFEPLLVGGNPTKVPGIYLLIHWLERKWGVHFAKGGTYAIVQSLVELLTRHGGELELGAKVERIVVENGRTKAVITSDGRSHPAELVVANADPKLVYGEMIDPKLVRGGARRLTRSGRSSMSLFVGYFATERRYTELAHHTILLGPRYQELLADIFDRRQLASDFSLYLHAPTRSDPAMAPEGKDAFYVLSPVPNLQGKVDWESQARPYFDRILEVLEQKAMPGLRSQLKFDFHVDPRYFEQELHSKDGAAFGLEPSLSQSAYFRYHNQSSHIGGLYFVGASTHPGAGLPGVLSSAKVLERLIPEAQRSRQVASPALSKLSPEFGR